ALALAHPQRQSLARGNRVSLRHHVSSSRYSVQSNRPRCAPAPVTRRPGLPRPRACPAAPHPRILPLIMRYDFLIDTYGSERLKTLNVRSMSKDPALDARPHPRLDRDRTPREHMVPQCMSEDKWFTTMLGIDVGAPPLPAQETRLDFIRRYAEDSEKRLA